MPTLQELNTKVDELQGALDTEQEQIAAAITGLNETITTLQGQVADGGTEADRQAVLDKLTAIKDDLAATIPDANGGTGDGDSPVV
jgi:hypothetical protein